VQDYIRVQGVEFLVLVFMFGISFILAGVAIYCNVVFFSQPIYLPLAAQTKDHIEKIDFRELSFAAVNWPNSEFYGAFVCIICYIGYSATNQLAKAFLILGCGFL